jgi:hypothetical protein
MRFRVVKSTFSATVAEVAFGSVDVNTTVSRSLVVMSSSTSTELPMFVAWAEPASAPWLALPAPDAAGQVS